MRVPLEVLLVSALAIAAAAQTPTAESFEMAKYDAKHPPRFEDFPVTENWSQPPAPLKLATRSERMFKPRLTSAAKEPPDFAGHYKFATWGCGSECISGAIVDLATGGVFSPPLASESTGWMHFSVCQSAYENSGIELRVDSRLLILRCGLNYSDRLQRNVPDVYYFVWEDNRFRRLLYITGKEAPTLRPTRSDHR